MGFPLFDNMIFGVISKL